MLEDFTTTQRNIANYLDACMEFARECGDRPAYRNLYQLKTELEDLTFNVAIIGSVKRGKSTLINTLLRQDSDILSPVHEHVCTGTIVKYRNYKADMPHVPHALVRYENSPGLITRVGYADLKNLISDKYNPDNIKGISSIEVYGDFPMLGNCCLVDTPGHDADIERHGEIVQECLPTADAIIFPIMVERPMTDTEQSILRQLSQERQRRIFYVLTMVDEMEDDTEEEKNGVREWIRENIREAGLTPPAQLYEVSAGRVFEAMQNHADEETLAELRQYWGISQLEQELETFMRDNSQEQHSLANRLTSALTSMLQCMEVRLKANKETLEKQNLTEDEVEEHCRHMQQVFEDFRDELDEKLQLFSSRWERTVEHAMETLSGEDVEPLANEIAQVVEHGGLREVFTLQTTIARKVSPYVSRVIKPLAAQLEELTRELHQDFTSACNRLYAGKMRSDIDGLDALIGTAAATPALATIALSTIPALNGIYQAASGIVVVSETILGFSTGTTILGSSALLTALSSAIIPVILGYAAYKCAGPLARYIALPRVPRRLDEMLKGVRDELSLKLNKMQEEIVLSCHELLKDKEEQLHLNIAKERSLLLNLDENEKARALEENAYIAQLLEQLEEALAEINRLSHPSPQL